MEVLFYTDIEYRMNEEGFEEKYVYVPIFDEWMTEDQFFFQKSCYDPAIEETKIYEQEHGCEDFIFDDEDDDDDDDEYDDIEYETIDFTDYYSSMSREEAIKEYERTGINHSEYDLNDWEDINNRLGFNFYTPKK